MYDSAISKKFMRLVQQKQAKIINTFTTSAKHLAIMESEVVSCFFMLMMMAQAQYFILQEEEQRIELDIDSSSSPPPSRYLYRPPIHYASLNRFTFIGMNDILCYHLTRFLVAEIQRLLPLLGLHNIRFRNRYEATPEEAFAVVLIRLSYPCRYWSMMNRFGHSRSWLSVVFNDTIIHIYKKFKKILEWDE